MASKKQLRIDLHAMLYEISTKQVTRGGLSVGSRLRPQLEADHEFKWTISEMLATINYKT